MIDTTTPQDLAEKIEWIGFSNLAKSEVKHVAGKLMEVSEHLPRIIAVGVWKHFSLTPPAGLKTKSPKGCLDSFLKREAARKEINDLMADVTVEDFPN